MPNIPYPNVPQLPGVPALARSNNAQFVSAALNVVSQFLPLGSFGINWSITNKTGAKVINPDSFIDFEYREERKIPNYPIEQGSFQSYNKVAVPFDIRLTVSCSGNTFGANGRASKTEFLSSIQTLLNSLDLVDVTTPNKVYENCNLVHVDYRREAKQGATLIVAQLWFQEVRIAQKPVVPTAKPSGAKSTSFGQLSPTTTPSGTYGTFNPSIVNSTGIKFA